MKTKVGVFFGGRSVEHEVSIITGIQALCALDRDKYDPIPVYISKENRFYTGEELGKIETPMLTCFDVFKIVKMSASLS